MIAAWFHLDSFLSPRSASPKRIALAIEPVE
jgi:hypothetical protein